MEEHVAGVLEQAPQAGIERHEVVVALAGHEDLGPVALQPLDQVLAEKPGPAGHCDALVGPETLMLGLQRSVSASGQWPLSVVSGQSDRWQTADEQISFRLSLAAWPMRYWPMATALAPVQTLANGFWNSMSWAARTSSEMPRSRSMVVSKPFLRIFS